MSISIIVSDKLTFDIKGETRGEEGRPVAFDFTLTARRMKGDELQEMQTSEVGKPIVDKLCDLVQGWKGVKGPDGAVEFSTEVLRDLLTSYPGLPSLVWTRYLQEVAVKAKN